MNRDINEHFERVVMPLIARRMPQLVDQMTVQIWGSYGLGLADEHSDLDAVIHLDDALWKEHGAQLQLLLETECPRFANDGHHPDICVWPVKWLGKLLAFLDPQADAPWEQITVEELHKVQENLVLYDPQGLFAQLRQATHPDRAPEWLWRKWLLRGLGDLQDMMMDYRQCIRRNKSLSASIRSGAILETLLHIGFYIHSRYYPWPTHLRWAFEKLPPPMDEVLQCLDLAVASPEGDRKLAAIESVLAIYTACITDRGLLPTVNLMGSDRQLGEELEWANRLKAWSNPDYKDKLTLVRQKAGRAGHPDHWWIWMLWNID